MEVILNASYSTNELEHFSGYTNACNEYECGCDVKGDCNPDCPDYNPSPDCWVGG